MQAIAVPVQASPFVFHHLALGAQQAMHISDGADPMPQALIGALKAALSEIFVAAFKDAASSPEQLKSHSMSHRLQLLFDLRFLRVTLSSAPAAAGAAVDGKGGGTSAAPSAADEPLSKLTQIVEDVTLSDPVDRLLYQEVMTVSVENHVEAVKILLSPFFLHNPLYSFLTSGQASFAGAGASATGSPGFEIQATFAPPLRPVLPRFPLLPVATTSIARPSSELDARMGLGRDAASPAAASGGSVSSLMQQVGSGLGSLSLGSLGLGAPKLGGSLWGGMTGASPQANPAISRRAPEAM